MQDDVHLRVVQTLERTSIVAQEIAMTVCGKIVSQTILVTESLLAVTCPNCVTKPIK